MPNTYTQLYTHIVCVVKNRAPLISRNWDEDLYKYITGILKNKDQKLISINGMPDHIHMLIGIKPNCNISDLVREIKKSSTQFINDNNFLKSKFQWQEGYAAFSIGHKDIGNVVRYIESQKAHHKKKNFQEEYVQFLNHYGVEYNLKYL